MCGLAGFLQPPDRDDAEALHAKALRMADALRHRGPDDRGSWTDAEAGVALGFRRLAIVDLSPEGRQPMPSESGRHVLVFNGEIYNYEDLRLELGGSVRYRGRSDTEVMLAAVERWGVVAAVRRFVGMFAFALWDRDQRRLTLGRDRLGEKPLYHGWVGDTFLFGSELKALRAHPEFQGEIDRDAAALYLRHGYVPAPYSIYQGIRKLPPGTLLTIDEARADRPGEPSAYWSALEVAEAGMADPFQGAEADAAAHLEDLLRDSVRGQMIADVPLGAFLSGGIDSSTVVALMQAESARPVKTFSIGFEEAGFDEAGHAKRVARHLGTEHTELYVTPVQAMEIIPSLKCLFDEPFADSSAIPFHLVSQLARRDVTVSLSGDGGDELFGGYAWYPTTDRVWRQLDAVPRFCRGAASRLLKGFADHRAVKLAELLGGAGAPEDVHRVLRSHWAATPGIVLGASGATGARTGWDVRSALRDPVSRAMLLDTVTYLPDDILTKVDRASMGASLEARAPFLDHRVVEFAWRVPTSLKLRGGQGKWLLRQVLDNHVPLELVERPKAGFSVPIGSWLRGPLRDWAEDLLDDGRLTRDGLLDPAPIRRTWAEHLAGRRDWSERLWGVLMLNDWIKA